MSVWRRAKIISSTSVVRDIYAGEDFFGDLLDSTACQRGLISRNQKEMTLSAASTSFPNQLVENLSSAYVVSYKKPLRRCFAA